jgi:hypothetical protein
MSMRKSSMYLGSNPILISAPMPVQSETIEGDSLTKKIRD